MNELSNKELDFRQLLTVDQVADTLQLSTKQVRRLIEREEIPAYRFCLTRSPSRSTVLSPSTGGFFLIQAISFGRPGALAGSARRALVR